MYSTQADIENRISKSVVAQLALDQVPAEIPIACQAAINAVAGSLSVGVYGYKVTFAYPSGEGIDSYESTGVTIVDNATAGRINLSAIPVSVKGGTARKIYRTKAGGSVFYFLAQISDNTTTTYADNIADASLGGQSPTASVVGEMITKADILINSYISQVYQTPLVTVDAIIKSLSVDLACFYLLQRRPTNFQMPDAWKNIESEARDTLEKIADQSLGLSSAQTTISQEVQISTPTQAFGFEAGTDQTSWY
jgi:phage gp36-like protein